MSLVGGYLTLKPDDAYSGPDAAMSALVNGRGLHSLTFQLKISAFCAIGVASRGCLGAV
jgi:hypothetical protein